VEWTFQIYDVTNAFGGTVVHFCPTVSSLTKVFRNYQDVLKDIPDAGGAICAIPAGAPVFVSVATMIGDEVKDAKSYKDIPFLKNISSLGAWFRMSNDLARKDYIEDIAPMLEPHQTRTFAIVLGAMVYSLDEAMQDAIVHFTRVDYPKKNAKPVVLIMNLSGEMRRNDGSKSSLRHRKAVAWIIIEGAYTPQASDEEIAAVKDWASRLKAKVIELGGEDGPHEFCDTDGRRIKFSNDEQRAFLNNAKDKYDPTNLFRLNKNIESHAE
jgi:hypothetical protein